ncbi:MAG: hypothetical protein E7194_00030 [Erysipelotrichaceae bacterium]|nr:hypothetical protein [Erysipelotrichaceae bacterium]
METIKNDLKPEYVFQEGAAEYLNTTCRKIALFRKHKLLKAGKLGKNYVYKLSWLDEFMEAWAGYDLSNESKIISAIAEREWRMKHGYCDNGTGAKKAWRDPGTDQHHSRGSAAKGA